MPYQTGKNYQVNWKVESTFNVAPGATGATGFRPAGGGGMNLNKRSFASNEIRRDGLQVMGRHGSRSVAGSYTSEMSLGTHDKWFEALIRDTFGAVLTGTQADFTSITTTAGPPSTIVAASGSFITKGFRVGDVVQLTGHSTAGNNSKNLRITALTALVMTVAETLVTDAVADTTFTITRQKKITRLANTSYVDRTFYVEEYGVDTDFSEVYSGCVVSSARLQVQPNGMVTVTWGLIGADGQALVAGSSPYFTNPTLTTSLPMVAADAKIGVGGTDVIDLTSLDLTFSINAQGADVVASYVTPAMFTNQLAITGSFTALRKDLQRLADFSNEVETNLSLLLVEQENEPKDFFSVFLPSIKYADLNKNELGSNGPRTETIPILVGLDPSRTAEYDASSVTIVTSAP